MGTIAQQSIKGALANYLGVALGAVITFCVITDCLTQSEIGLTRVLVDAALLFSSLAGLGSNSCIVRFYPYFRTEEQERHGTAKGRDHGFFGLSLLIPGAGLLLFVLLFLLMKEPIAQVYAENAPMFRDYMYWVLPLTFFALFTTVFETHASVLMRITVPKMVREVGIRLFNLIAYLLYGHGLISIELFVGLFCSSYALAMVLNLIYLISLKKISLRIDWDYFRKSALGKEIGIYTLFMTATTLAGNIPLINSLFLGAKGGLALAGIYTIASYIANVVEVPYRSLGAIAGPCIAQATKEHNLTEVNRLARQVSLHQFLVASLLFFFIWINLEPLFGLIPNGESYRAGIGVVFYLGIAKIINSSLSIGTSILNYSPHYMLALPLIGVLTLTAILCNNYLIPLLGINGSALATLGAYIIYFLLLMWVLHRKMGVGMLCRGHLTILVLLLAGFGLNALWDHFIHIPLGNRTVTLLLNAGLKTTVFALLALWALLKLNISPTISSYIHKYIKKIKVGS